MRLSPVLPLILLCGFAFGQSQEQINEKLLSFLPEGEYQSIVYEMSSFRNSESSLDINSFSLEPQPGTLPASFVDLWAGRMTVTRIVVTLEEVSSQEEINSLSLLGDPLVINDKVYKVSTTEEKLFVYHYLLLTTLVKEALTQGQMKLFDESSADPVYEYIDKDGAQRYMAILDDYLLVAADIYQLSEMLAANRGEAYSFFFQDEGRVLLRNCYKLQGNWSFWSNLPFWRSLLIQVQQLDKENLIKYLAAGELERGCVFIKSNENTFNEETAKKYFFAAIIKNPSLELKNLQIDPVEGYTPDDLATNLGPRHPAAPEKKSQTNPPVLYHNQ